MSWYLEVLKKYAVFSGRARRKEFWMFYLVNTIISFGLQGSTDIASSGLPALGIIISVIYLLYFLAVLIPSLAVTVRRLHDTGRSGWWLLSYSVLTFLSLGVFVLGFVLVFAFGPPFPLLLAVVGIVGFISVVTLFFVFLVQNSQPGENRYGPNPKEAKAAAYST